MGVNRGKAFESVIKESFLKVPDTHVLRLHDQTNGFKGSCNHCDFIIYHFPFEYHIECKSISSGATLPFRNITDNQKRGLIKASETKGVIAGVICWWITFNTTLFIPIETIVRMEEAGLKSVKYNLTSLPNYQIPGRKKRIFFDYDMESFFRVYKPLAKSMTECYND